MNGIRAEREGLNNSQLPSTKGKQGSHKPECVNEESSGVSVMVTQKGV
jgi:hypothetical protein